DIASVRPSVLVHGGQPVKLDKMKVSKDTMGFTWDLSASPVLVCGDVKIQLKGTESGFRGKKVKLFHLWFHTGFLDTCPLSLEEGEGDGEGEAAQYLQPTHQIVLTKPEIDKVRKDKKHKKWPIHTRVVLRFVRLSPAGEDRPVVRRRAANANTTPINYVRTLGDGDTDGLSTYGIYRAAQRQVVQQAPVPSFIEITGSPVPRIAEQLRISELRAEMEREGEGEGSESESSDSEYDN
ncbi:hypothetical protein KIPB_010616, partial [Kipferlia bialata]